MQRNDQPSKWKRWGSKAYSAVLGLSGLNAITIGSLMVYSPGPLFEATFSKEVQTPSERALMQTLGAAQMFNGALWTCGALFGSRRVRWWMGLCGAIATPLQHWWGTKCGLKLDESKTIITALTSTLVLALLLDPDKNTEERSADKTPPAGESGSRSPVKSSNDDMAPLLGASPTPAEKTVAKSAPEATKEVEPTSTPAPTEEPQVETPKEEVTRELEPEPEPAKEPPQEEEPISTTAPGGVGGAADELAAAVVPEPEAEERREEVEVEEQAQEEEVTKSEVEAAPAPTEPEPEPEPEQPPQEEEKAEPEEESKPEEAPEPEKQAEEPEPQEVQKEKTESQSPAKQEGGGSRRNRRNKKKGGRGGN
eukprot:TRINITY_DN61887_c0_g2_i1.p1 TRINITY_DN61887_c0_g2~~TRINITY_DN61887_c0_g2_i1.p1  ORF type:complete len:386 (+),score=76.15 TRINITY_DN61887_c0_g2_i1:61-1158(+)